MDKKEIKQKIDKLQEEPIDNKLELVKYTSQVQSRIRTDISSDLVLCKLNQEDKEGIIEMTSNAYFAKKVITNIAKKAKKKTWNNIKKEWEIRKLNKSDKEYQKIIEQAKLAFDAYMTRIMMTAILNRNVDKNYILNILAQQNTEEQLQEEPEKITLAKKPQIAIQNEEGQMMG